MNQDKASADLLHHSQIMMEQLRFDSTSPAVPMWVISFSERAICSKDRTSTYSYIKSKPVWFETQLHARAGLKKTILRLNGR